MNSTLPARSIYWGGGGLLTCTSPEGFSPAPHQRASYLYLTRGLLTVPHQRASYLYLTRGLLTCTSPEGFSPVPHQRASYLYLTRGLLTCTSPEGFCNGPCVVQRKDRQKKEFHDQSDYRQWCMLLMSSTNLSSHTGRHNKQFFSQCSGERQNIFEKLQYHPAPHTPNGNIHPHISSFIHYSFR